MSLVDEYWKCGSQLYMKEAEVDFQWITGKVTQEVILCSGYPLWCSNSKTIIILLHIMIL